ncbi:MAG TPA: sulfite exporter TauE/SafE family protein [Gaiellaceae bacterium]|nr:sulfite exporter TauE/SafE family protein [Gaiellaceae bacterium]
MTWQFSLAGLLVGSLVGLTGMGGGSLMTPILVIVFGFNPTYAVGTDIVHGAIFKSFGAVRHRRLGTVHAHLTLWMFLGSGPLSLVGVWVADVIKTHYSNAQTIESYAVGAALVAGGLGFLAKSFIKRGIKPSDLPFILTTRDKAIAVAIGAIFGFVVGLTSVGSGTFFGLVMVLVYPMTMAKIVGTDIFHAAALLWVAGIGHMIAHNVDYRATGWLLIGSIPGVLISSRFTVRVSDIVLRLSLGTVLVLTGLKLLNVPESKWILLGGLVGLAVGLAAYGVRTWLLARPRLAETTASS